MKEGFYKVLRGTFLVSDDSFKNWRIIIFISVLAIIMIASSHSVDKKVYEVARLKNEVNEMRSAFIDGRSRLMKLKMESTVLAKMKVKGLQSSVIPPKKIRVKIQNKE
ncbi:MAG: FtsL-like putative cell division protein [Aestuariibaculum sp.]